MALRRSVLVTLILLVLAGVSIAGGRVAQAQTVFIDEIHYDNAGRMPAEAIEIAGPAGTDLTGWSLVLYNGMGGPSTTRERSPESSQDSRTASAP